MDLSCYNVRKVRLSDMAPSVLHGRGPRPRRFSLWALGPTRAPHCHHFSPPAGWGRWLSCWVTKWTHPYGGNFSSFGKYIMDTNEHRVRGAKQRERQRHEMQCNMLNNQISIQIHIFPFQGNVSSVLVHET